MIKFLWSEKTFYNFPFMKLLCKPKYVEFIFKKVTSTVISWFQEYVNTYSKDFTSLSCCLLSLHEEPKGIYYYNSWASWDDSPILPFRLNHLRFTPLRTWNWFPAVIFLPTPTSILLMTHLICQPHSTLLCLHPTTNFSSHLPWVPPYFAAFKLTFASFSLLKIIILLPIRTKTLLEKSKLFSYYK